MALILSGDTGPSFVQSAAMPSGSVLQVVQGSTSTVTNCTSSSFVATSLSATITPSSSSSKVLAVLAGGDLDCQAGGRQIYATIYRNSTNLGPANGLTSLYHDSARSIAPASASFLDSPATTSATTYTVYVRGATSSLVQFTSQQSLATLTLTEIAG